MLDHTNSSLETKLLSDYLGSCPFSHLALPAVLDGGQVVDSSILQHRQEDKDKADPEVNVHCLDVGHPGHGCIHTSDDGGHGQHCSDAWTQDAEHSS